MADQRRYVSHRRAMQGHEGRIGKEDPKGTTRDYGGLQRTNRLQPARSTRYTMIPGAGGTARQGFGSPISARNFIIVPRPHRTEQGSQHTGTARDYKGLQKTRAAKWRTSGAT